MQPDQQASPVVDSRQESFLSKYKFTLLSLAIILLAAIPLILLSNKKPTMAPNQPVAQATVTPTPTVTPITSQNVNQQLDQTQQDMQNTMTQVDSDLKAAAQVDSSQDSTTGL